MGMGAYTDFLTTFFLIVAKQYAKCVAVAATPSQYDPMSYQFRLISDMEQRSIEYRGVPPATPDDTIRS